MQVGYYNEILDFLTKFERSMTQLFLKSHLAFVPIGLINEIENSILHVYLKIYIGIPIPKEPVHCRLADKALVITAVIKHSFQKQG